jgi:catecholate siderophore receptor
MNINLSQKIFKTTVIAASITAAISTGAYAQDVKELDVTEAQTQSESSYAVEQSTSQKYTQPLLNTPKTLTIISQAAMKDRGVESLRDALRNVPGISMAAGEGGSPTGDSLSIRGFSAANNIMIDGVRDVAGYTRDTYNVESVEVAKGPGSSIYGRGSAGGTINLQTKTAQLDQFVDVGLRIGTEADYRGQVDANIIVGETSAVRVNALIDDSDTAGRDDVFNSNNAIALSFAHGLGTDSRLSVNADYQAQDNLPDYGLPWIPNYSGRTDRFISDDLAAYEGGEPPVDYSNFYGNVNRDFEEIDASSITLKYEKDISETTTLRAIARTGSVDRLSIVNAPRLIYTTDGTLDSNGDEIRTYGDGSLIDLGGEKTRDTENTTSILQFDLTGQYDINGMTHNIVTGIELSKETFDRWNYADVVEDNLEDLAVDLYNPDSSVAYTGSYARTDKSDESTADTTAFYVVDTITLNEQWQVSAGLRYDMFDTEYDYDLDEDEPAFISTDEEFLSWNFGVVFKPSKNGSIYFGSGNAFTSSAEDATANTRGNSASLDPEETLSYEIGTKWSLLNETLFVNAAIFRTEKINALSDDPLDDDRDDLLEGEQRVTGLELSAAGEINENLSITAAYTYQDSEVVNATGDDTVQIGYELARTPKHSATLWGKYTISDKIEVGFGAQYMGERYNSSDPTGRELADSYLTFDMMASYQVSEAFSVQLNGSNLTDEEYADQLGGGHFIPGDGRYFRLNANYSF